MTPLEDLERGMHSELPVGIPAGLQRCDLCHSRTRRRQQQFHEANLWPMIGTLLGRADLCSEGRCRKQLDDPSVIQ